MLKDKKRKRIAILLAIISVSIVVIVFMLSGSGFSYHNKVIAVVNNERIYISDAKEELLDIFPRSNPKTFEVRRLPRNVLEMIAKSVYIKRHIYKEAKRSMLHKDPEIRDSVNRYAKKIIRDQFIDLEVRKKITKDAIRSKYLELSDSAKEDKEFGISHILLKSEYQAKKVTQNLNKKASFSKIAQKYSVDKKTNNRGGDLGYFKEDEVQKEFSDIVLNMKEGDISKPIQSKKGWHIVKLIDIKTPILEDFKKIESKIIEDLKREEIEKIFSSIAKNAKVKVLIDS
jgi:peptidyl-prolyl cis-trans isomerase C